jgi:RNA polymerase sigma-70 factor (ECF subfamily)
METEERRLLHKALAELKPRYRTVVILRYFEGRSIAELSLITGQRQGTVKSQLHRGLVQLQDSLIHFGVLAE